ncbi:MAG: HipA domain-containing protein, partial [Clostridia bacterium]|nr:HipA domain-containing protein [Clostridia bacterium]
KNISFLMDKKGVWSLSPAYDITFSYRKDSIWVSAHQMLINGKADNIEKEDLLKVAEKANIKKSDAVKIIEQVINSVSRWEDFAEKSGMSENNIKRIKDFLNV